MSRTREAQAAGQNRGARKPLFVSAGRKVHIETLGYKVTFEPLSSDDADLDAMPEKARERLYYLMQDDPRKAIPKLEAAVAEHPNSQTLHNWLSAAYGLVGQIDQAERVMELNYQKHPNYLFARVNIAEMHIRRGRLKEAAAVMDGKWDVKQLYPDRDVFHATEVAALAAAAIRYFALDGQIERARQFLDLYKEVSPNQQAVRGLEKLLEESDKSRWQLELAANIRRQRAQGWGWRWDGVESWTTETILEQAHDIGIDTDAERFAAQAASAGSFKALQELWVEQISPDKRRAGFWEDFPVISVKVLWERLAPHVVCADLIEHRLYQVVEAEGEGIELPDVDGVPADVHAALDLAGFLRGFPADQRAAQYKLIEADGYQNYGDWLIDLVERRGPTYPDQMIDIVDVVSDAAGIDRMQLDLAIALAEAGRRDEAISRARAAIDRQPDDVWARIWAGDVYERLGDDQGAIGQWRKALSMAKDRNDWEGAAERLTPVLERLGRQAELSELIQSRPRLVRPTQAASAAGSSHAAVLETPARVLDPILPITRGTKIGRNDPCPCGSGKKYKKCCLPKE